MVKVVLQTYTKQVDKQLDVKDIHIIIDSKVNEAVKRHMAMATIRRY